MKSRKIDKTKYVASFAIATLIFLLGIWLGTYFSAEKLSTIDTLAEKMQLNTLGTELQFSLISEKPCEFLNSSELTDELYQIGARLDFMESEMGQTNRQVLRLKEYYHLLELRHWIFLNKARSQCNQSYDLLLYFYSNKGNCPDCADQGNVLTYLHKKYPELNIYSFDININNPALKTVKSLYKIQGNPPFMVINGKTYIGFMNSVSIEEELTTAS